MLILKIILFFVSSHNNLIVKKNFYLIDFYDFLQKRLIIDELSLKHLDL